MGFEFPSSSSTRRRTGLYAAAIMILAGIGLLLGDWLRPITIFIDGIPMQTRALAWTVADALHRAGIKPTPGDQVIPLPDGPLPANRVIHIRRARPVLIQEDQVLRDHASSAGITGNLLLEAGIYLFPGDQILWNGLPISTEQILPTQQGLALQLQRARPFVLRSAGQDQLIYSAQSNLGAALWDTGIRLSPADRLSAPLTSAFTPNLVVEWTRSRRVEIELPGKSITFSTTAQTTGEFLREAGVALVGLDASLPPPNEPIPANGKVRVVRIREDISLEQSLLPFKTSTQPDPQTDLDQRRVIQAGQYGVHLSRTRTRYENNQVISSQKDSEWTASPPRDQVTGIGTKVVLRNLDTPGGSIQYWRAVNVYATSYSPCRQGMDRCSKSTASGTLLDKGVIAVTVAWYRQMAGQRVYIPGYGIGVIADTGGGIPGRSWIDLGFSEDNFELWHQNVTMYFLPPVPPTIPWILP